MMLFNNVIDMEKYYMEITFRLPSTLVYFPVALFRSVSFLGDVRDGIGVKILDYLYRLYIKKSQMCSLRL